MKYLTLSLLLVLSLACGRLPELPDTVDQKPQAVPVVTTPKLTLCEAFEDALYCADSGVPAGVHPGVPNGASIGLFARFEADPSFPNLYGRLVELGGDTSPGGGAALFVSGLGAGTGVGCAWWVGSAAHDIGATVGLGEHTAYCEIDANGARLYVDGVLAAENDIWPYDATSGNIGVKIAAHSSAFGFAGTIEEVAIFSSLTTDEIALISR